MPFTEDDTEDEEMHVFASSLPHGPLNAGLELSHKITELTYPMDHIVEMIDAVVISLATMIFARASSAEHADLLGRYALWSLFDKVEFERELHRQQSGGTPPPQ